MSLKTKADQFSGRTVAGAVCFLRNCRRRKAKRVFCVKMRSRLCLQGVQLDRRTPTPVVLAPPPPRLGCIDVDRMVDILCPHAARQIVELSVACEAHLQRAALSIRHLSFKMPREPAQLALPLFGYATLVFHRVFVVIMSTRN